MHIKVIRPFHKLWMNFPLASKGAVVVAIPIGCLVTSLAVFALLQQELNQAEQWVKHTQEVQLNAEKISYTLSNVDTGIKGYFATQEPDFLQFYYQSIATVPDSLNQLTFLVDDNPIQTRRLKEIERLVNQQLAIANRITQLSTTPDQATNPTPLSEFLKQSRSETETIRQQLTTFIQYEEQLLEQRSQTVQRYEQIATSVFWLCGLVGIVGGFIAHRLYSIGIVRQIQQLQTNAY
jgi:CHASE3 domain sensor protein